MTSTGANKRMENVAKARAGAGRFHCSLKSVALSVAALALCADWAAEAAIG
jgi:hypothetical protein